MDKPEPLPLAAVIVGQCEEREDMAASELHFLLVPLVAQGHIIPMVDLARLLAALGPRVTVVTTPVNAARNRATVDGARRAGLAVELVELPFPARQLGLPEGLENLDQLLDNVSSTMYLAFFKAIWKMAEPLQEYVRALPCRPDGLIADSCNPWTAGVCTELGIPRLVLHCPSAYFLLAVHNLSTHGVYDRVGDDEMEPFEVPDFPVRAVGNTATFRGFFQHPGAEKEQRDVLDAEATADGLLLNTFRGVEGIFVDAYAAALGKRTWAIGPTCASGILDKDADAMASRGNRADVDVSHVVSWLDARPPASVLYISFGSIAQLPAKQLAELASGIEASGRPFVWAIKRAKTDLAVKALLDDEGFVSRVEGRGLLVRGWAPQVTILSHPAVGGFLTHCGWNATLEAISHGVPALTWPCFADQFCSERLLVDVLRIGVRSGVKVPAKNVPGHCPADGRRGRGDGEEVQSQGGRCGGESGHGGRRVVQLRPGRHDPLRLGAVEEREAREGRKLDDPAFRGGRAPKQRRREDRSRCCIVTTVLSSSITHYRIAKLVF
ncbi:UDP-glycosyltransferase 73C1-like isoform X1 [Hordeum vulgare subsp. vulgare]|uniref:UDP-glycosyltransferase 73C1-like isoform X1 n=1 Tax=Hordeum vulgare subsp. vulgare TaxID=112509 RepID=UPI001D1A4C87|nr:UDP-glycosyltransferase 73C1-like isoform X1 [Hordeum vulgare subsp. vulgare]